MQNEYIKNIIKVDEELIQFDPNEDRPNSGGHGSRGRRGRNGRGSGLDAAKIRREKSRTMLVTKSRSNFMPIGKKNTPKAGAPKMKKESSSNYLRSNPQRSSQWRCSKTTRGICPR